MHKIKKRSRKNIIGLKLSGTVSRQEYEEIVPVLEDKIKKYGKIRLLIELDHWEGWGPFAGFKDFIFVLKNSLRLERVAFILRSKEDRLVASIDQPFSPWLKKNTRIFSKQEKSEAWDWVEEGILLDKDFSEEEDNAEKKKKRYGSKLKVLIIGGGVSGLTLAALLQQKGLEATLVEAKQRNVKNYALFKGWSGGCGVLKSLGIFKKALKSGTKIKKSQFFKQDGELIEDYSYKDVFEDFGPAFCILYPELTRIIAKLVHPNSLHFGLAATKISQSEDEVKVSFSDGTRDTFDCVICSDGIHSRTRELIFDDSATDYSGMMGWSFTIDAFKGYKGGVQKYLADDRAIEIFPIKDYLFCFARLKTDEYLGEDLRFDLLQESFKDFGGVVPEVLQDVDDAINVWHGPLYTRLTSDWVNNRVAFIGNAVHSFLPNLFIGSAFPLVTAQLAADAITKSDTVLLSHSLKNYEVQAKGWLANLDNLLKNHKLEDLEAANKFGISPIDSTEMKSFWEKVSLTML